MWNREVTNGESKSADVLLLLIALLNVVVGLKASVWKKELSLVRLRTSGTVYFNRWQYNAVMRSETLLRNWDRQRCIEKCLMNQKETIHVKKNKNKTKQKRNPDLFSLSNPSYGSTSGVHGKNDPLRFCSLLQFTLDRASIITANSLTV